MRSIGVADKLAARAPATEPDGGPAERRGLAEPRRGHAAGMREHVLVDDCVVRGTRKPPGGTAWMFANVGAVGSLLLFWVGG